VLTVLPWPKMEELTQKGMWLCYLFKAFVIYLKPLFLFKVGS
jgi:hypothetical protein